MLNTGTIRVQETIRLLSCLDTLVVPFYLTNYNLYDILSLSGEIQMKNILNKLQTITCNDKSRTGLFCALIGVSPEIK